MTFFLKHKGLQWAAVLSEQEKPPQQMCHDDSAPFPACFLKTFQVVKVLLIPAQVGFNVYPWLRIFFLL